MKNNKTILLAIAVISMFTLKAFGQTHLDIQPDKVKHFAAGAIISSSTGAVTYKITGKRTTSLLVGFGTGVLIGAAKEFYDAQGHGCPSFKDALWTGIGAGVGSVSLRFSIPQTPKRATITF